MKTSITKGLTGQAKDEMVSSFNAAGRLRERLETICRDKQETARKGRMQEEAYQSPNWSLLQADYIGYARALEEIISLLK